MKPIWICHRGLKTHHLENTREAFDAGVAAGFTWLETDLRATSDGHVVLNHDETLDRVVESAHPTETIAVSEVTRSKLESVRLKGDHRLMFMDEFITRYAAYNWVLDIKPSSGAEVVSWLINWAKQQNAVEYVREHVKFLCWVEAHESALREAFPGVTFFAKKSECWRAGLAVLARIPGLGAIKTGRTYSVVARIGGQELFDRRVVETFRVRGARALAFLPTTLADAQRAVDAGFDEILSDSPWFRDL